MHAPPSPDARDATPWRLARAFAATFARDAGRAGLSAALLVGAAAIVDGIGILVLIPIIGAVVGSDPGGRTLHWLALVGAESREARLAALLAAFVLLACIRAVTLYARDMKLARLQASFAETQRMAVMARLAAAPWHRVASLRHARVTNLMTQETNRIAGSAQFLIQGGVSAVMLLVQGALALALAPLLALAVGVLVGSVGLVALLAQRRIRDLGAAAVSANVDLMSGATSFLAGLKAAAAQNAQHGFLDEFRLVQANVRDRQIDFARTTAASRRAFAVGSAVLGAIVVAAGVMSGVSAPVLVTIVVIFARMSAPAQQLQQAVQNFFFALPSFGAVRDFLAEIGDEAGIEATPAPPPPGPIEATALRYLHPGGGGITAASFHIAPGAFIGIAGPSGAGKTTLLDLLIGLLEPQAGTLTIGDRALDAAGRAGWRAGVAYVPQEGFLFHDSVRRNLTWGARDASDAAIRQALEISGATALVNALPQGLETIVGERGGLLSGGERQRLAIARALLCAPRLLVLDEATNAIDAAGEAALLARLAALDPRPTIVMVSHRAESLVHCDRILSVEAGRVTG